MALDVRAQLEAEKRLFGYRYHPSDAAIDAALTDDLARVINDMGIGDIRDIGLYTGHEAQAVYETVCRDRGDSQECVTEPREVSVPVAYFFNRRTNARLHTALVVGEQCRELESGRVCDAPIPLPAPEGPAAFYTVRGPDRWVSPMDAGFTPGGIIYFIPNTYRETSSWQDFRGALTFFFAVASFAIPGLGAAIGQYVFGAQLAASYPALVSVATNTAFNAVLGGADIDDAVKRAVASYAGAGFGDIVGAQVDSSLIGKLTSAATTARLNGTDVQQAVLMASLQAGASGNLLPTAPASVAPTIIDAGETMDEFGTDFDAVNLFPDNVYAFTGGEPAFADAGDFGVASGDGAYVFDSMGDDAYGAFLGDALDFGAYNEGGAPVFGGSGDFGAFDPSGGDYGVTPTGGGGVSTPPVSAGTDWDGILSTITKAALTAIQINKVYQATGSPAVKAPQPSQTVNANGTITTRTATGTVATSKLPVGAPYAMPDGSLIMNNGDGTYSITSPSGVVTRGAYAVTAGASGLLGGNNVALLAALGVGAVLLMRKGKR